MACRRPAMTARSYNWKTTGLQSIAAHVREEAIKIGRAVHVFLHGESVVVRDEFDARHGDDHIGSFDCRASESHVIRCLVDAIHAEICE